MNTTTSKIPGQIVRTASGLFASDGFQVGIDRIIADARIAKMSFYKFFPAKDKLIAEVIRNAHDQLMNALLEMSNNNSWSPTTKLNEIVRGSCVLSQNPEILSCLVSQAMSQFPAPTHFAHQLAAELRTELSLLLEQSIEVAYPKLPAESVAQQLHLLIEGYPVACSTLGQKRAINAVNAAMKAILR